jgi:hypothetical protein
MKRWMLMAATLVLCSSCSNNEPKVPFLAERELKAGTSTLGNFRIEVEKVPDSGLVVTVESKKVSAESSLGIPREYSLVFGCASGKPVLIVNGPISSALGSELKHFRFEYSDASSSNAIWDATENAASETLDENGMPVFSIPGALLGDDRSRFFADAVKSDRVTVEVSASGSGFGMSGDWVFSVDLTQFREAAKYLYCFENRKEN